MQMQPSNFRSKRPLSEVDDCDECLPISKRINKLHIKGQRNSQDDSSACLQPEIGAYGMESSSQQPGVWSNEMGHLPCGYPSPAFPHISQSPAMISPVSAFQHAVQASMYQPMAAALHRTQEPAHLQSACPLTPPMEEPAFSPHFPQHIPNPVDHLQVNQYPSNVSPDGPEHGEGMDYEYDPELGECENPHYYHINHVLFKAHCQRLRREGYPLDSGPPSLS